MKITQKISLITILVGIGMAIFASVFISFMVEHQLEERIGQQQLTETKNILNTIDRTIESRIDSVEIIAGDNIFFDYLTSDERTIEDVKTRFDQLLSYGTYDAFLIVDTSQVIQAVSHDFPPIGIHPGLEEHLVVTASALEGKTGYAPFHTSRITGNQTISIASPIERKVNGEVVIVGALLAEINWQDISTIISAHEGYSYLLDSSGNILATQGVGSKTLTIPSSLQQKAVSGIEGTEVIQIEGEGGQLCSLVRQVGSGPFKGYGWSLVTLTPTRSAFSAIPIITASVGGIVVIFTLATVLILFWLVNRFLIHPLGELSDAMGEIEEGHLEKRVRVDAHDEFGDVATSFNEMTAKIEESKLALEQEKNRLALILRSIGDAVVVIDAEKRIVLLNPIAEKLLLVDDKDVIGTPYDEHLRFAAEATLKPNNAFIDWVLAHGMITSSETDAVIIRKDGSTLPVDETASPLVDNVAHVFGAVIVFRDVTKERETNRMKSEFVAVASHQLKTPLNRMKWFLELLVEGDIGEIKPEYQELVGELVASNTHMINLISDLLSISRIEQGVGVVLDRTSFSLGPFLDTQREAFTHLAEAAGRSVEFTPPKHSDVVVYADQSKLSEAWKNIVVNAIKYSTAGSKIKITVQEHEDKLIFSVKNDGIGIPKNEQTHLFERFFRASNVINTGIEGTGLGLSVSKSFIEAHDGRIWFESKEGQGATFYFSIPMDTVTT